MVRAFEPVHAPGRLYRHQRSLHQIAPAQRIARAVEAQHRHFDARQVRVAQLLRLARGMQRIGEEEQTVAGKAIGCEHRGDAPAHGAAADDERLLAAHAGDDRLEALAQHRHRIGTARALVAIREVEAHHLNAARAQRRGRGEHGAVVHMTAGAVRADEDCAAAV